MPPQLDPNVLKESCLQSFSAFSCLFQDPGFFDPVHQRVCDFTQAHILEALEKKKVGKVLVVMPRGSLKTTMMTKYFPLWLYLRYRYLHQMDMRSLIVSNTFTNATKKLADIRYMFQDDLFCSLFPEILPTKKCRWTTETLETGRLKHFPEGTFEAAGVGSNKVGSHYNLLIEDDTVAPEEDDFKSDQFFAPSIEDITAGITYHQVITNLFIPRVKQSDQPNVRIVVTTRWADFDLAQHVEEEGYHTIDIPALDSKGKAIFTNFYSEEDLEEIKAQVGPYMFSCLFLNKPLDASLRVFRDEWMRWVFPSEVPLEGFYTIAVDPAISEKDQSCETAITRIWHTRDELDRPFEYWTDAIHGHFSLTEQVNKILNLCEGPNYKKTKSIIVESVAYQEALAQALDTEMTRRRMTIPITRIPSPKGKKEMRIEAMQPRFADGKVFLVQGLSVEVESQLRQFPLGRLKDIIDSFSMHVKFRLQEQKLNLPEYEHREDPNSIEAILKEAHAIANSSDKSKISSGLESYNDDLFGSISSGLGSELDLPQALRIGRN